MVVTKVIPIRRDEPPARADAHMRFCLARRDMFVAYREWLDTNPAASILHEETEDTCGVIRQLRDLKRAG